MVQLPKQSVGGGILLSILHTHRNDAANYICPVLMYPSACLSMVAADGVPSAGVREEGEAAKAFFSPRGEPQAEEGCCCEVLLSTLAVLEGGRGDLGCLLEASRGAEGAATRKRNRLWGSLWSAQRRGMENLQVQLWSVWGLDEKEKSNKLTWKLI